MTWWTRPGAGGLDHGLDRRLVRSVGRHELGLPANMLAALPAGGGTVPDAAPEADAANVTAPVAGTLTLWQAEDGEAVEPGQVIAVIEAMKMETRVEAHRAGKLTRIAAQGAVLGFDAPLARID